MRFLLVEEVIDTKPEVLIGIREKQIEANFEAIKKDLLVQEAQGEDVKGRVEELERSKENTLRNMREQITGIVSINEEASEMAKALGLKADLVCQILTLIELKNIHFHMDLLQERFGSSQKDG